jgi:hypothetical protein
MLGYETWAWPERVWRLVTARTYEIVIAGEAVPAIVDAFDGYEVALGNGCTTVRAEQIDQAALHGAIARLQSLGLELLEVRPVDPLQP